MNQPTEGSQPPGQPGLPQQPPPGYQVSVPPPVPVTPIFQPPPQPAQPYAPQPQYAPQPRPDQPSWATYARPIGDIRDGHNAFLHDRDYEGQLAAASRGPMPWGFLAFFLGLGVFYIVGLALTPVLSHALTDFDNTAASDANGPLLIVAFVPNLAFALFPLLFSYWKGSGPKLDFGLAMRWRDLWIGLACGGTAIGLGILVNLILARFVFSGVGTGNTGGNGGLSQLTELSNGRTIWLALFALFAFIGAPITEELLFRGALWGALEGFKINRYVVLVLVTLVFAYGHQEPQATLALFCQGLSIGTARMITGRISSSMVAHATNNLIPALVLFFAR